MKEEPVDSKKGFPHGSPAFSSQQVSLIIVNRMC